jgi:hypothetical protein
MLLEEFLVKFLKYEILVVSPIVVSLQAGTGGTLSIPALFWGSIVAALKASKDVLEENISLKKEQKNELAK